MYSDLRANMMTQRQAELIELIHKEVKPALGCTEPIAVALAVAKAVDIISENCSHCGDCPCGGRRPISASPWR